MNNRPEVADWWKTLAIFLSGLVVSLLASYFQYGASKKDIAEAISNNNALLTMQLESQKANMNKLADSMDAMQRQMQRVSVQLGVNMGDEVYIDGKTYRGKKAK